MLLRSHLWSTARRSAQRPSWRPVGRRSIVSFLTKSSEAPNFNRWWSVPPALLYQLSVGSIYAWSTFNGPLSREIGVVTSAANDWGLTQIIPVFSVTCVAFGLTAAVSGKWIDRTPPRVVGVTASCLWGGGLCIAALGVHLHSLPLLYFGYGIVGGAGAGLGYLLPVNVLLKWFPDKKGMATGMAIMGFGGGAVLGVPLNEFLLYSFAVAPTFLGSLESVATTLTSSGTLLAGGTEVVVATVSQATQGGVYACGTGSTGVAQTFLTLGCGYWSLMLGSSLVLRVPPSTSFSGPVISTQTVPSLAILVKMPQFWLLWLGFLCNAFTGVTILSSAKLIMADLFSTRIEGMALLSASFVSWLSVMNMSGRLGWSALSDVVGRHTMFLVFGSGSVICAAMPTVITCADTHPLLALSTFWIGSSLLISFFGGYSSTLPAFLADIFPKNAVSTLHGYMLTAWSTAAVLGPVLMSLLRQRAYEAQCTLLANALDSQLFITAFGAPKSELSHLISSKTVTLPRLMELMPPGTVDPTPLLYDSSMYAMSAFLGVGLVCNLLIRFK